MNNNNQNRPPYTEINEILGKPPSAIVRWGNSIIVVIFATLLLLCWLIQYPDVIETNFVLQSKNTVSEVIANASGYLQSIERADKAIVKKGEVLGVIGTTAEYTDILLLESAMEQFFAVGKLPKELLQKNLRLGEVQYDYSQFVLDYVADGFSTKYRFAESNILQLQQQISNLQQSMAELEKIQAVTSSEYQLARKQFFDKQSLYSAGVIDRFELESFKSKEYQKEKEVKQLTLTMIDKKKEINQLQGQIQQIAQNKAETKQVLSSGMLEKAQIIRSKIVEWKLKYLLLAPTDGQLSYAQLRQEKQYLQEKEIVFNVLPISRESQPDSIRVSTFLTQTGAGKVTVNQQCLLKLDAFPYTEFGMLEGKIKSKSLIPKDNKYYIEIQLENGLNTTFNKPILAAQQMTGTAMIVTEKKRLLNRLVEKITGKLGK